MPIFDGNLPYTNLHELNLDWIVKTTKEAKDKADVVDENLQSIQESEENARQYAENAKTSEENAKTSEDNAKGYYDDIEDYTEDLSEKVALNTQNIAVNSSRIDSFTNLAVGSTTGDAELIDGRIGYDGTIYPSIGDAIRTQVSDLADDIIYQNEGKYEVITTTTDSGHYYLQNTNTLLLMYAANAYANTTIVPCQYGDKFKISFKHMSAVTGIWLTDTTISPVYGSYFPSGTATDTETDWELEITDAQCTSFVINGALSGGDPVVKKFIKDSVKDKIARIEAKITKTGGVLTVSPTGQCDYTTIQDAVDDATNGDTILVYPGTYVEQVNMKGKVLNLIGLDKRTCVVLDESSDYRTPPIQMGAGTVMNLTVIEDHEYPDPSLQTGTDTDGKDFNLERAYCIHIEDYTTCHNTDATTLIENCYLINTKRACLGIGLYQGHTVIIRNCDMWTGMYDRTADVNRGALYFHSRDDHNNNTTDQKIRIINNTIYSDTTYSTYIVDSAVFSGMISDMECEFINNMAYSAINGKHSNSIGGNTFPSTSMTLAPTSYGNNVNKLNS